MFEALYQQRYGAGTIRRETPLEIISFRAEAVKATEKPNFAPLFRDKRGAGTVRRQRPVYMRGRGWIDTSVYAYDDLAAGRAGAGPGRHRAREHDHLAAAGHARYARRLRKSGDRTGNVMEKIMKNASHQYSSSPRRPGSIPSVERALLSPRHVARERRMGPRLHGDDVRAPHPGIRADPGQYCFHRVARAGPKRAEFYKGKTIQIMVGFGAGGGYDLYARALARHLGKHMPGQPTVVVQNMEGAGSVRAANYVYSGSPKDGTVIAAVNQNAPMYQLLGGTAARFEAAGMQWLGSMANSNGLLYTWAASGIKTLDDAKTREVPLGAVGTRRTPSSSRPSSTSCSAPSSSRSTAMPAPRKSISRWSAAK